MEKRSKMKVLSVVKIHLKILGLLSMQKVEPGISKRRMLIDFIYILLVFASNFSFYGTSAWFFFFKAQSFEDFSESGIFFTVSILVLCLYTILLQRRTKLIALIRHLEEMIERSMNITTKRRTVGLSLNPIEFSLFYSTECAEPSIRNIYETTNIKAEKWPKIMYTMVFKVYMPLFVYPVTVFSYYTYYIKNTPHPFKLIYVAS